MRIKFNAFLKMKQVKMQRKELQADPDRKFNHKNSIRYFKAGWKALTKQHVVQAWGNLI
jgi:hypothetical protein